MPGRRLDDTRINNAAVPRRVSALRRLPGLRPANNLQCELHVAVVFIEVSALARVLKEPTTIDCDIGFSATTEQCLVVASCTTQYSSGAIASAGIIRAEEMIAAASAFCIGLSPVDFSPLPSKPLRATGVPVVLDDPRDCNHSRNCSTPRFAEPGHA
jgi:hypothetical protein